MLKVLRNNLQKLTRDKVFWLCLFINSALCLAFILTQGPHRHNMSDALFFGPFATPIVGFGVLGMCIALSTGSFIGTDYSNGTIRNKLIAGIRRHEIYLANFLSSVIIGLVFVAVYYFLYLSIGVPMFGWMSTEFITQSDILLTLATGLFIIIAYASISTFISMLSRNLTIAMVTVMILVLVASFVSPWLQEMLNAEEFIYRGGVTIDGVHYPEYIENTLYISSSFLRGFIDFLANLIPTSQALILMNTWGEIDHSYLMMIGTSIGSIIVVNTSGCLIFRKLNLK